METPDKAKSLLITAQNASQYQTGCGEFAKRSYACLEKIQRDTTVLEDADKDKCSEFFEAYKACRKKEHDALIEARRNQFRG